MEWRAPGLVIAVRAFGETSAICDVFTRDYGRYGGLVRGGASRKTKPVLQIGNRVDAQWRARLSEHLGALTVELDAPFASLYLHDPMELAALTTLCGWLHLVPERQAYPRLYDTAQAVLEHLSERDIWPALLVRFEMAFLEDMGFGLDLTSCAATGATQDLNYISPRSGRVVSTEAAQPYLDRMFPLPGFLRDTTQAPLEGDIAAGFDLMGHFISRRVLEPSGQSFPVSRSRLLAQIARK
jgi:DNA repair protein RecO (recombination protein O)